jgi:hypothetical protein
MLIFEISANGYVFTAIVLCAALAGFGLRTIQIARSRSRIICLEREIKDNHAEILDLQRDFISLELKTRSYKDAVTATNNINSPSGEEKLPDISLRKKLLGLENSSQKEGPVSLGYGNLLRSEA